MNKLAIALSAALSLGAVASASAADAVINFEGKIEALTCNIGVGTAVSNTLTMPTISPTLISSGAAARQQAFTLTMGTDEDKCATGDVTLSFEDVNLDIDGYLQNTQPVGPDPGQGGAANVRMAILDGGTAVNLKTYTIPLVITSSGIASKQLTASYEPVPSATPGAGLFKSALHVSVQY